MHLHAPPMGRQVLQHESTAVLINGVKQTLDVDKEACFTLGWKEAETFYTTPLGAHDKNGVQDKHGGFD